MNRFRDRAVSRPDPGTRTEVRRHGAPVAGAAGAVLARPGLWPTAVRQVTALAGRGWWRRPPYLPLPDPAYLAFRQQTMYGDPACAPSPADVVAYLSWCRGHRRLAR